MYASDFLIQNKNLTTTWVYLSGDNDMVRNLVINKLATLWAVDDKVYAAKQSDLVVSSNKTLFGSGRLMYICSGKVEPRSGMEHVVKIASSPANKKYKDLGFEEISCNGLFNNQIEAYCKLILVEAGSSLPSAYVKFVCVSCDYDLSSIINVITMLSYLDINHVRSLSHADFSLLCDKLAVSDENTIAGYFIDGNYSSFLSLLQNNSQALIPSLRALLYALMKAKSIDRTKKPTWYQQKLLSCLDRLELCGVDLVVLELHRLAGSFFLKPQQVLLRLHILIKMVKGEWRYAK
jgi:hypothetical protein